MVTRFNGSPSVHHFLKPIYVKYAEIYDTRDNNKERLYCPQITSSLLSFHLDGSGRILVRFEHGEVQR